MKHFVCFILCICVIGLAFADTININWYANNSVYDTTTCTIGDTVTPPTAPVPKYGYHFSGWKPLYTQLEYIESTGTQYIDTGAYITSNNLLVKTKVYSTSASTTEQDVFGNQDSTTGRTVFGIAGTSNTVPNNWFLYSRYGTAAATPNNYTPAAQNQIFNIDAHIENGQKWFVIDGVSTETTTATDITNSNATVQLFANGKSTLTQIFKGRIYYFQMWNNGTLVRNFIPCKNASNVVGMYDLVNGVFYQNAGTGVFIAGPESGSTQ